VELQTVLAQKQAVQRTEVLRSTQLADAGVMAESKVRWCIEGTVRVTVRVRLSSKTGL
jgi:hypothetical protein